MNELDHVRRVLHGVDDEVDPRHLLDRVRARAASGKVLRVPLSPAEDTPARRSPRRALVAAAVAAAFAAGAAGLAQFLTPVPMPAGPTASDDVTASPPPAPSTPVPTLDDRHLVDRVAKAMIGPVACAEAGSGGDTRRYLIHTTDGTWSNATEDIDTVEREEDVQRLALDELLRLAAHPGTGRGATDRDGGTGPLLLEITPATDSGLAEMTLTVDPATWLPTTVAVLAADGPGTRAVLELAWDDKCHGPASSGTGATVSGNGSATPGS
ncbi:hypothetical protein [Myceligenerans pegani]|uniref:Uncharacterized protein n=1 Tax=Myceligenerans pegani TaxID=2776917 RepID=A0ABR9MTH1_9MICO|nr:hypothetical protein [Myceligenerans sp. TRM 65318]MBE1874685.1 hypothetical protein [Myceligenerans sp. TRM 65318]MBE3016956.1 hypothetical protein [Myceligenerans sp. TRM 65318]